MARSDEASAAQHFGSSVSIFDMLGDRYRSARAHFELGKAYASTVPSRAGEHLSRALNTFRELGARLDLEQAENAPPIWIAQDLKEIRSSRHLRNYSLCALLKRLRLASFCCANSRL